MRYYLLHVHTSALLIFCIFFAFVTLAGFWAARWRRPATGLDSLDEWGLAGRSFGTWITWFLLGGDLYTAYTVIAVPAALYGTGANAFFALPYAVLAYPYMFMVLPRLWNVCHRHNFVTFADFVGGRYGNRALTLGIAVTGIMAVMPYIALQLVGMRVVIAALGLTGEWPLAAAFVILAAYTYSSGLRAPAIIAVVKDTMLYIMVLVADAAMKARATPTSIMLAPKQFLGYSTLAVGSAIALMLYPHTATAVLSAKSAAAIRRNSAMLPAYSFLLGLIALLGYIAIAADVHTKDPQASVPALFFKLFPEWFAGFCLAAIAIGALVPAAIMSIAASNLFTRNIWGELTNTTAKSMTAHEESNMAKIVSLVVKFGALIFVLKLPATYAIEMQLLGGIWIGQIFPAVVIGVFTRWFNPWALFCGLLAGLGSGTWMVWSLGLKSSVYPVPYIGNMYAAVPALLLNLAVATILTLILRKTGAGTDITDPAAYVG
jgi:SSS family solute:Na+ symporter